MCRSATEITFMCDAIMQGMDRLDNMLQSQAVRLDIVVQYRQALQQDQQVLIQGQDILIRGQRVLLQEVASLHKNVVAGTDSLSMVSQLSTLAEELVNNVSDLNCSSRVDLTKQ